MMASMAMSLARLCAVGAGDAGICGCGVLLLLWLVFVFVFVLVCIGCDVGVGLYDNVYVVALFIVVVGVNGGGA